MRSISFISVLIWFVYTILPLPELNLTGNICERETYHNHVSPKGISITSLPTTSENPDTASIIIPLKRIGKLYLIEATIDGESGNLVFDTGASCLVLNRTYFRDHISMGEQSPAGITGNVGNTDRVAVNIANVGPLKFRKLSADLSDLGHIENRRGVKILGLFGFELIKKYEIQIDYSSNQLRLYPVDSKGQLLNPSARLRQDFAQKIEVKNNILFTRAIIAGRSLKFCFDTGAETNVLSSDLPKPVMETVTITRTSKLRGAGASSSDVFYGRMNNFLFGDSLFNHMETVITYLGHLDESYGTQIDGVLGFDFISKGIICINFVNNQMGITYFRRQNNESD